ncbi:MAG TPA: hypothetical protein VIJ14_01670 [Rhabdochlamydiaceae bacterium]
MTMQQATQLNPWVQEKLNEITSHCAWHAELTGIEAEALLRLKPSFTYLIRQGEKVDHFYLSFIKGEEFCHLPFTIDYSSLQWFYRNTFPHFAHDLKAFVPEIMHREETECHPLVQFAKKR